MDSRLLDRIEAVSGRNEKEALLATADEQTQRLLVLALDPLITFGVTVDEDEEVRAWTNHYTLRISSAQPAQIETFWAHFEKTLPLFCTRALTGNRAKMALETIMRLSPSETDTKWACRIINRNLRAGFDIRTFNRVFGKGSIKKFEVQLAETYEGQELEGTWVFEPKLDGNRVVGYEGKPKSRGDRVYPAAEPIFDELRKIEGFFDEFVPDGEMMGDLGFDQSSGALRRSKDKGRKKANFIYWLFDMFTLDEYDRQSTAPLSVRKARLEEFFKKHGDKLPNVRPVPWLAIKDPTHQQVMEITAKFVAAGFEGAMAKRLDAPAKFGRGPDLLKVKLFFEDEFKVVDFYEGKGKHKGNLGGVIIEGTIRWSPTPEVPKHEYRIRSECGSGFAHVFKASEPDRVLRQDIWNNKAAWLGAVVQIQFQSPTEKKNPDGSVSLRLPVFIMRRKDKE